MQLPPKVRVVNGQAAIACAERVGAVQTGHAMPSELMCICMPHLRPRFSASCILVAGGRPYHGPNGAHARPRSDRSTPSGAPAIPSPAVRPLRWHVSSSSARDRSAPSPFRQPSRAILGVPFGGRATRARHVADLTDLAARARFGFGESAKHSSAISGGKPCSRAAKSRAVSQPVCRQPSSRAAEQPSSRAAE